MSHRRALCLLFVLAAAGGSLLLAGPCDPPTPIGTPCDDGNACTTGDACNSAGLCVGWALNCNAVGDSQCMINTCDPATGCVHTPRTDEACYFPDPCYTGGACGADGYCHPGSPVVCPDRGLCNAGYCRNGLCEYDFQAGSCDDGNACTNNDHCAPLGYRQGGYCVGDPITCDDGNVCTVDGCDPATGCLHNDFDGIPCDADHSMCTVAYEWGGTYNDWCQGGACVPGPPKVCDDGNGCTIDSCDELTGCSNTPNGACGSNPEDLSYWQQVCEGPQASGEFISQADVDCVRSSCTFASVATVAELCDRLDPNPRKEKCEKAEAQFMALLLNVCRGRTPAELPIRSACSDHTTVGQSRAEVDGLLCSPQRDAPTCMDAACMSREINTGRALRVRSDAVGVIPVED
jgi:hypothetical protein